MTDDMTRTQEQVRVALRKRGLGKKQARIGSAIALCEAPTYTDPPLSDFGLIGDQDLANETWGFSYGGFQIRSRRDQKGTGGIRDEDRLVFPSFNIDSAVSIFRTDGWDAWSTFRSGMYEAYLPDLFPIPPDMYRVVGGDTLSGIAAQYNNVFTWQDLARLNDIREPYVITIGQLLLLPE